MERTPIGVGTEKRIFQSTHNDTHVEGVYHKPLSNEEIKGVYYYNKLLHILFPVNTTDIHRAGNTEVSSFIADHVVLDEQAQEFADLGVEIDTRNEVPDGELFERIGEGNEKGYKFMNDERVEQLHNKFATVGVPLDWNHRNFTLDKNGEVIFLDMQRPYQEEFRGERRLNFDLDKLKSAIDKLDGNQRQLALTCFERIMELHRQLTEQKV